MNDTTYVPILVGHLWAMPKEGPWGGFENEVRILDVREGWVRYDYEDSISLHDNRRTEESFRKSFQWVSDGRDAA